MADQVLMIGVAVYLAYNGFWAPGIVVGSFYALLLSLLGFGWLLCRVRIPIEATVSGEKLRSSRRQSFLVRVLVVVVALVPLNSLVSVWPTLDGRDLRLGMILSGLAMLLGLAVGLLHPPVVSNRLRSLRSRLAFGRIAVKAAGEEAESIVHGSPEEEYLTAKADEVAAELEEYIRLCDSVFDTMQRIIGLAEKLRGLSPEERQRQIQAIVAEFRPIFSKGVVKMRKMPECMKTAAELRRALRVRVEAARLFLEIPSEALNALVAHIDDLGKAADGALAKIADPEKRFEGALRYIYDAQKDVPLLRRLSLSDAYAALFRD